MERDWYGWQILLLDGAAIGVIAAAPSGGGASSGLLNAGVGTLMLGPPIVHFAHGNTSQGFLSLGLTAGIPAATGALTMAACTDCGLGAIAITGLTVTTAYVVGSIIDVSLAYVEVPAKRHSPRRTSLVVAPAPTFDPTSGRAGVAVTGTF